ncbi:MmyB family transcriptional regulator [Streptomyces albospinus]|uniref:MmyB family transcriptional regulator n=1 Tax=Streptomyces albospinus TaxID=285515 RepID=UPI003570949B
MPWQLVTMPRCRRAAARSAIATRSPRPRSPNSAGPAGACRRALVGDPDRRLSRAGEECARQWASGDVAPHAHRMKVVRYAPVGEVRLISTSLGAGAAPETRIVVSTPADEERRGRTAVLRTVRASAHRLPGASVARLRGPRGAGAEGGARRDRAPQPRPAACAPTPGPAARSTPPRGARCSALGARRKREDPASCWRRDLPGCGAKEN